MRIIRLALFVSFIGAYNLAPAQTAAAGVADFYKKTPMTLYVGYAPGGGYDTYARVLAEHMPRHVPGNPTMIVKNMPGADSLLLMNHLYNQAPKDGTTFGIFNRNLPVAPLLGLVDKSQAKFDPMGLFWIGSLNNEVSVVAVWHETGIRSIKDAYDRTVTVGATGTTANNAVFPYVLNNLLGTKFKVIAGYPGSSLVTLAIERGEVDGNGGWSWTSIKIQKPEWIKDKKLIPLVQLSVEADPELTKMGVPLVTDIAKTEEDRKVFEIVFAPQAMGRPLAGPPGLAEDRKKALRAAFDATAKDPAFIKAADKARLGIVAVGGERVEQILASLHATPRSLVERAKEVVKPGTTEVVVKEIPVYAVKSKLTEVRGGGRQIRFLDKGKKASAKISGSRTAIVVAGQKGKRKDLRPGMSCEIRYQGSGSQAERVSCE
jgi:tripartite-type tricarboxylate transporter receptor subunit TctC